MKTCSKCKIEKPLSEFHKDKQKKAGFTSACKDCYKLYLYKNKNRISKYQIKYRKENKDFIKTLQKNYYGKNSEKLKEYQINYRKKYPWKLIYQNILTRCNNINDSHYKYYGERGIECLITEKEIKYLWFRDKAWLLKKPSIDRKDNDGNYELSNCRFIEHSENVGRMNIEHKSKPVNQYSINNKFIKSWNSIIDVERELKILHTSICNCLSKRSNSAGGFKWRYV